MATRAPLSGSQGLVRLPARTPLHPPTLCGCARRCPTRRSSCTRFSFGCACRSSTDTFLAVLCSKASSKVQVLCDPRCSTRRIPCTSPLPPLRSSAPLSQLSLSPSLFLSLKTASLHSIRDSGYCSTTTPLAPSARLSAVARAFFFFGKSPQR